LEIKSKLPSHDENAAMKSQGAKRIPIERGSSLTPAPFTALSSEGFPQSSEHQPANLGRDRLDLGRH
jgi:hypothetical protein